MDIRPMINGRQSKHWKLPSPAPHDFVETLTTAGIHPMLAEILFRRGYENLEAAQEFLSAYGKDDNPFTLYGMSEAVYRLRMAIRNKEPIAVYGDFDCDGVCSTALLVQVLDKLGA